MTDSRSSTPPPVWAATPCRWCPHVHRHAHRATVDMVAKRCSDCDACKAARWAAR